MRTKKRNSGRGGGGGEADSDDALIVGGFKEGGNTDRILRRQQRKTRRAQRKYERQSKRAMKERMRRRYSNGGRGPGGINVKLGEGFPENLKRHLSTAPFKENVYTTYPGGDYSQYQQQGQHVALKEILRIMRNNEGILGIPTGRQYEDYAIRGNRDDFSPTGEYLGGAGSYLIRNRDDIEKTYRKERGRYKVDSDREDQSQKKKTVEIGGEDLNWFQRNFPGLFLERYKVKSKYDPEGELVKRVTTSRAGGRQVERFPTRAELEAIIAEDIRRAQAQNGE